MASIGDIYELKHQYRDFDQKEQENVYFYRQVADPSGGGFATQSQRLAEDWITDVYTPIRPLMPSTYVTHTIRVRNLFELSDGYVKSISLAGTRAASSEYQPSFLAGVIHLSVDNWLVKKGRKMIAGLLEGDQATGMFSPAGIVIMAARAALCLVQVSTLFGGAKAFVPVVVRRIPIVSGGETIGYTLPGTQGEATYGNIISAVASAIVSAQDTRKK